jgi:hypothetical protein
MSKLKPIPPSRARQRSESFGKTHDSTDYIDWSKAGRARFPNLKPSTIAISILLPEQIKITANKRDVSYR